MLKCVIMIGASMIYHALNAQITSPKNYISILGTYYIPTNGFRHGDASYITNIFANILDSSSTSRPTNTILKPENSTLLSVECGFYLKKYLGIGINGYKTTIHPHDEDYKNNVSNIFSQFGGLVSGLVPQNALPPTLVNSFISGSATTTPWELTGIAAGPLGGISSGIFTIEGKILGGITFITTPSITTNLLSLYNIEQKAVSVNAFTMLVGYNIRARLTNNISLIFSNNYIHYFIPVTNYTTTYTNGLNNLQQLAGVNILNQPPDNIESISLSASAFTMQIGLAYTFSFDKLFTKNKSEYREPDIEKTKQGGE
ncbi:MAG: hypothetical protein NW207_12745 [Cytophagales bacterium]|nr:hypothetical protein [Cytophagales bacterium]